MKEKKQTGSYQPIENYGIVGNLHTVALIGLNGSIDFMCFPRFDSPSVFCKLLDAEKGGSFSILPVMEDMVQKQLYLPNTNVLVTRFFSNDGIAEVTDFMPVTSNEDKGAIIRIVKTVRGNLSFRLHCAPRFNYAKGKHFLFQEMDNSIVFQPDDAKLPRLRLAGSVPVAYDNQDVVSDFCLSEGQSAFFILEAVEHREDRPQTLQEYVSLTYQHTLQFWQNWLKQSTYKGPWMEMVHRSALTLKLLTSRKYGSMVAAPTFSLPEAIGEGRNWDYRYTWIRDAAFAMHAFLQLGFIKEAESFLQWVRKQSTRSQLQLMFAVDGRTDLEEYELDYLEGYKQSKPVRVGNAAHAQVQMDIYGELLETLYVYVMHGGDITYDFWKIICGYVGYVMANWQKPDHSIWEVRGEKRDFLFSRLMCWVCLDRAIKIGRHFSYPYDILKWHQVRNEIFDDIYDNFWSEEKQAFVQYKGGTEMDASALLMPILNYISPYATKWRKTMQAIDEDLRSDVLIYRYRQQHVNVDGLKGKEGTFTMCSFWYVECLALMGRVEEAKENFEKALGYANHLGLFAEELSMKGEHLGNFPQAFTHLALISAAMELQKRQEEPGNKLPHYDKEMK